MSEVVPLPSFGEVFFDARGQERCLRVTWHEGTLVLSLWRGEMCTASFRMPMEDVGRLLDTLDDGYAEATGEQPAVPAHDPGTEAIPGTGTYHRPAQTAPQPAAQAAPQPVPQAEERPAATLSPNDVLVARGAPQARQDKLVASYADPAPPRDTYGDRAAPREQAYGDPAETTPYGGTDTPREPAYGETAAHRESAYGETAAHRDTAYGETTAPRDTTAYGERAAFTGPQYVDTTAPQQRYTGDPYSDPQYTGDPYSGPQYTGDPYSGPQYSGDPFTGPQYTGDALSGPHGVQQQAEPFTGPQYVDGDPVYQMPAGDQRRSSPNTDPLGFPSQAAEPYQAGNQQQYPSDPYGGGYQQSQPQGGGAGLGTPMHGIPGAGRPRSMPQRRQPAPPARDDYPGHQATQSNPVDPLLAMGRQEQYQQQGGEPDMSRPYVGDPMFSTGERLRPEQQQPDYHERSDRREW